MIGDLVDVKTAGTWHLFAKALVWTWASIPEWSIIHQNRCSKNYILVEYNDPPADLLIWIKDYINRRADDCPRPMHIQEAVELLHVSDSSAKIRYDASHDIQRLCQNEEFHDSFKSHHENNEFAVIVILQVSEMNASFSVMSHRERFQKPKSDDIQSCHRRLHHLTKSCRTCDACRPNRSCSHCGGAFYCSRKCQRKNLKTHLKNECSQLSQYYDMLMLSTHMSE